MLRNNLPDHPVTLHPHGVLYNKSSEGAPYADGTPASEHADDAVLPGQVRRVVCSTPAPTRRGGRDPSCTDACPYTLPSTSSPSVGSFLTRSAQIHAQIPFPFATLPCP